MKAKKKSGDNLRKSGNFMGLKKVEPCYSCRQSEGIFGYNVFLKNKYTEGAIIIKSHLTKTKGAVVIVTS